MENNVEKLKTGTGNDDNHNFTFIGFAVILTSVAKIQLNLDITYSLFYWWAAE
jgi:hypothetical protein